MSGVARAIGAQEFAGHEAASPSSPSAVYLLLGRNENGDIADNPAAMVRRAVAGCPGALDCHGNVIKPSFHPTGRPQSQGWARGGVAASLHWPCVGAPMAGRSRPR